jgi:Aminoglycoside-2''-adenylyltransferase
MRPLAGSADAFLRAWPAAARRGRATAKRPRATRFRLAGAGAPKSFELVDGVGSQVDVHPVAFSDSGDARFLMDNDEYWIYPTRGFAGEGLILDRAVRCLTPEIQMLCHTGCAPHRSSSTTCGR